MSNERGFRYFLIIYSMSARCRIPRGATRGKRIQKGNDGRPEMRNLEEEQSGKMRGRNGGGADHEPNIREKRSLSEFNDTVFLLGLLGRVERNEKAGSRGRSGEMVGPRSLFHQMPPFTRTDFGRGARTTGRGSVDRTKRSQAFSIQSLGQNPWANCMSKRRTIRHTTYLS